jgi:serine/threonine-protein kinase
VIHRDVKPHNILLTPDGQPKLTDFGIARVLEQPGLTMEGRVLGTGDYLAPEQAAGEPLDARVDVYALGVLLYHALCGEVPFHAESYVETARLHAQAPVPSVRERRPDAPERLDQIVTRALAKRPDDRYPDAAELRDDLHALAAELREHAHESDELDRTPREPLAPARPLGPTVAPVLGPVDGLPSIPGTPRRGLRIASIALLILVLGAGAALAAYLVSVGNSTTATTATQATSGPTTELVGTTPTTAAALKPVKLLSVTSYDPQGDDSESQYLAPRAIDGGRRAGARRGTGRHRQAAADLHADAGLAGARVRDPRGSDPA